MEIVRLAGPPGVGKSTVAWSLAQADAAAGVPVAYVDIDQLGMCFPAPCDDADRWLLKERALRRIAPEYAAAGIARLFVSGVASAGSPPPLHDEFPTRSIWLDAPEDVLRERLAERGWPAEQVRQVAAIGSAESERADPGWARVDTGNRMPQLTASEVRTLLATIPAEVSHGRDPEPPAAAAGLRVLWLSGARVAGTSTLGWALASEAWAEGRCTGFMDVAQLSFVWNVPDAVGSTSAGRLGRVFAEAGATDLVIVAPLHADTAEAEARGLLAGAVFTEVRVAADEASRLERILARREDRGPMLAGDDVFAASDAAIDTVIAAGAAGAETPLRPREHLLDTSRLTAAEAAARLRAIARR